MANLPRTARFFVSKTATQTLSNRTAELVNWDTTPTIDTPAGWFSNTMSSTSEVSGNTGNAVTINVPGIYLMTCQFLFDTPTNISEWLGLWLYRNNAGVMTVDKYLYGGKGADGGQVIFNGCVLVKVTAADIAAGDNVFQILAYQAETPGATGSGGGTATFWDILFLDKV